jgi:hypothetical protein
MLQSQAVCVCVCVCVVFVSVRLPDSKSNINIIDNNSPIFVDLSLNYHQLPSPH